MFKSALHANIGTAENSSSKMDIFPWNSVLQAVIILLLASCLHAEFHYPSTAQVPKYWINNQSIPSPQFLMPQRIILFAENPSAGNQHVGFACGFISSDQRYDSLFFVVGLVHTSQDGPLFSDVTWNANRNRPVGLDAILHLHIDGNLELRDADGTSVWSTNTSNRSVVGIKMMETGNLVLYGSSNETVWQSFDHPTDTLLLWQKLVPGQRLVASASETNLSEGNFYLSVTSQGLFAFYQDKSNAPQMYFRYVAFGGNMVKSIELNFSKSGNGTLALFFSAPAAYEPFPFDLTLVNKETMPYVKIDSYGHLMLGDYVGESINLLDKYLSECDYPTSCGDVQLCSDGKCSCPEGYVRDFEDYYRCIEKSSAICVDPQSQSTLSQYLLPYKEVYHFSYVNPDAAVLRGTDMESCKEACLKNCSCKVALFLYIYNISHGNCFIPSPVLTLINEGNKRNNYQSYAFIKISEEVIGVSARSEHDGKRGSHKHSKIIVASAFGTFLLSGLILGCSIMIIRNKRNGEEGMENFMDQLSGMPLRFTYESLKIATEDFQKKLGEGGFGSVFEGRLKDRQKIAVKRLDSLVQGKKEFLAEVKTISSIHHNNMVRLIGFCAENLHRLLVYEFMCNGSLDKWIFWRQLQHPPLDWPTRATIILNIAKGLAYLHHECRKKIVHLDIKPQNILLDENLHAKISDFGLSRLIDRDQSRAVTAMRGTPGYMAPELFTSVITEKADVYSFGIVVMEVACGRKNVDRSQPEELMHLLPVFLKKAEENQLIDMVDRCIEDMQVNRSKAVEMMKVAIWCLQRDYRRRPSMSAVVKVLEGTTDMEADLDYSIHTTSTMAAIRREAELATTASVLPSFLSGPR